MPGSTFGLRWRAARPGPGVLWNPVKTVASGGSSRCFPASLSLFRRHDSTQNLVWYTNKHSWLLICSLIVGKDCLETRGLPDIVHSSVLFLSNWRLSLLLCRALWSLSRKPVVCFSLHNSVWLLLTSQRLGSQALRCRANAVELALAWIGRVRRKFRLHM